MLIKVWFFSIGEDVILVELEVLDVSGILVKIGYVFVDMNVIFKFVKIVIIGECVEDIFIVSNDVGKVLI